MQVQSREEIRIEFLRRSRVQKIYSILAGSSVLLFFVYRYLLQEMLQEKFGLEFRWAAVFFLLVLVVVFLLTWINWRCPLCHSYMGMKLNDFRCPRCGVSFELEESDAKSAREKIFRSND